MKLNLKLIAIGVFLAMLLSTATIAVEPVFATNPIQNPGFEYGTAWVAHWASVMGTYAKIQDSAYKHTGSYSGLTQTTDIKQEFASATLYQSLSAPVSSPDSRLLVYWIRKGSSATGGYYTGKVCIFISGGYTLSYYHGFDGSPPPSDSSTYKYINVGNPATNTWVQVARNLYNDLVAKFGSSIQTQTVSGIEIISNGYVDIETLYKYGQRINWDDLALQPSIPVTVSLTSSTLDGQSSNVGTITFAGSTYSLPTVVDKQTGSYSATANPPSGYSFHHWETIGGITVSSNTSQTTTVTANGAGTLKAVFNVPIVTVNRYAIIVCGADVTIGFHDAAYVYHVLKGHYGFSDSNICYMSVDTSYPGVDMLATLSNFRSAVSSWLATRSTGNDMVFIYFVGHGGGLFYYRPMDPDPQEPFWTLWGGRPEINGDEGNEIYEFRINRDINGDGDQTDPIGIDECLVFQNQFYWDDDLKSDLACVNYGSLVFATQSCFGGGFIDDLSANNRIILTATEETSIANSDMNNDGLSDWTKVFCDSLHQEKAYFSNDVLVHSGELVDSDTSDNLRVSMKEAYQYARENDFSADATNLPPFYGPPEGPAPDGCPEGGPSPADIPKLDDNGDGLANSNDGPRASFTYIAGLTGDVNRDGIVNNVDVNIVDNAFGSTPGGANWNPIADVNEDLIVNFTDRGLVDQDRNKQLAS